MAGCLVRGRRKKLFGETYREGKEFLEESGLLGRQLSPLKHRVVGRMWISRPLVIPKQKGVEGFGYLFLFPSFPSLVSLVHVPNSIQGADSCFKF